MHTPIGSKIHELQEWLDPDVQAISLQLHLSLPVTQVLALRSSVLASLSKTLSPTTLAAGSFRFPFYPFSQFLAEQLLFASSSHVSPQTKSCWPSMGFLFVPESQVDPGEKYGHWPRLNNVTTSKTDPKCTN